MTLQDFFDAKGKGFNYKSPRTQKLIIAIYWSSNLQLIQSYADAVCILIHSEFWLHSVDILDSCYSSEQQE
jgi:hypothetical protein